MQPHIFFLCLVAVWSLVGCAGNLSDHPAVAADSTPLTMDATPSRTSTPESVATSISESTVTSRPSETSTSSPTSTPSLTSTSSPTSTSLPTSTSSPTPTSPPTSTSEPVPLPTSLPATQPAVTDGDTRTMLLGDLAAAVSELNNYHWTLFEDFLDSRRMMKPSAVVRCQPIVGAHDHILSLFSFDVSNSGPAVQNARSVAIEAVRLFDLAAADWTNSCRQAIVEGNETNVIGRAKYEEMTKAFAAPDQLWNQAMRVLDK